jgi:hypothetical protein
MVRTFLEINGVIVLLLPFVIFFIVCGLAGGLILYLFRINRYVKAVGQVLLITLASVVCVFFIWLLLNKAGYNLMISQYRLPVLLLFWLVSVVVEGLLLKLLNPSVKAERNFMASITMNLIAYSVIYGLLSYSS